MLTLLRGTVALAVGIGLLAGASVALAVSDSDIRQAQAALEKSPDDDARRIELAKLHYVRGADLSAGGRHAAAGAEFKAGLAALETKPGKVPERNSVYEETRYGLAYSYLMQGQPQDAVVLLDQLVISSPQAGRARYLLGVALLNVHTEASYRRGVQVLSQLGEDSPDPERAMAIHAASRYVYDVSIGIALADKARAAAQAMSALRARFGAASGADAAENEAMQYGAGSFQMLAGNPAAGLAELENLRRADPGFALKNGVTLAQVLSNSYYQIGLDLLAKGTPQALTQALAAFDNAERYGSGKETDTHHGKALVYKKLKQGDKFAQEMAAIRQISPQYYKKINTGT